MELNDVIKVLNKTQPLFNKWEKFQENCLIKGNKIYNKATAPVKKAERKLLQKIKDVIIKSLNKGGFKDLKVEDNGGSLIEVFIHDNGRQESKISVHLALSHKDSGLDRSVRIFGGSNQYYSVFFRNENLEEDKNENLAFENTLNSLSKRITELIKIGFWNLP